MVRACWPSLYVLALDDRLTLAAVASETPARNRLEVEADEEDSKENTHHAYAYVCNVYAATHFCRRRQIKALSDEPLPPFSRLQRWKPSK